MEPAEELYELIMANLSKMTPGEMIDLVIAPWLMGYGRRKGERPLLPACPSCGLGHGRRRSVYDWPCPDCEATCCTATCLREHGEVAHPAGDEEERRDG